MFFSFKNLITLFFSALLIPPVSFTFFPATSIILSSPNFIAPLSKTLGFPEIKESLKRLSNCLRLALVEVSNILSMKGKRPSIFLLRFLARVWAKLTSEYFFPIASLCALKYSGVVPLSFLSQLLNLNKVLSIPLSA